MLRKFEDRLRRRCVDFRVHAHFNTVWEWAPKASSLQNNEQYHLVIEEFAMQHHYNITIFIGGFHKWGFIRDHPIKMVDWGSPPIKETPRYHCFLGHGFHSKVAPESLPRSRCGPLGGNESLSFSLRAVDEVEVIRPEMRSQTVRVGILHQWKWVGSH